MNMQEENTQGYKLRVMIGERGKPRTLYTNKL